MGGGGGGVYFGWFHRRRPPSIPLSVPSAPLIPASTVNTVNSVTLTWADNVQASPSQVYQALCVAADGPCGAPAVGSPATGIQRAVQTAIVSGLASNTSYSCYVIASNAAGATCSTGVNARTAGLPPPATAVNASSIGTTTIALAWVDGGLVQPTPTNEARCTAVGTGCAGAAVGVPAAGIARGVRAGTVTGLTPGARVECYVRSSNAAGSTCSDPLQVQTYVAPVAPTTPVAAALSAVGVTLRWQDGQAAVPAQTLAVKCTLPSAGSCAGAAVGTGLANIALGVQEGAVTGLAPGTGA